VILPSSTYFLTIALESRQTFKPIFRNCEPFNPENFRLEKRRGRFNPLVKISAHRFVPGWNDALRVEVETAARRLRMKALKSLEENFKAAHCDL